MNRVSYLLVACAVSLGATANAQTVQSFDGTRCFSGATQYWLTGSGMVGPHGQLTANGYSVLSTGLASAANLAGADVFVTGAMELGTTLSMSEETDVEAWVSAGGGVLYIGDNDVLAPSNSQFATMFSLATYAGQVGGSYGVTISAPNHPLISGPFGTVTTLDGFNTGGGWTSVAAGATIVCTNPDGTAAVIAADYGAGRVVLVGDANFFSFPSAYTADKAILWDNTIDWLNGGGCTGGGTSYCTAGTTSSGCHATMGVSGAASLSNAAPFTLSCTNVEGNKNGIFFYGITGRVASRWGIGGNTWLCVKAPTQRMNPLLSSGGTAGTCSGTFSTDWNAYVAANPAKPINAAMVIGTVVASQAWFRDPASGTGPLGAKGTALSDGIEFTVCP